MKRILRIGTIGTRFRAPRRMYFVPEGQHDRSLARSAWESSSERTVP